MVGDADAIEPAAAIEIHDLGQREPAIGVIGVDVEIAKQHARSVGRADGLVLALAGGWLEES